MELVLNSQLISYQIVNPKSSKVCLILHGWGHSSSLWTSLASLLNSSYRYLIIDLPGFGNSPLLPNDPDIPQYSQIVSEFINKLKINKPVIIGHSFGGQIAAHLAITHPSLFKKIYLISPAIIRDKSPKEKIKIFLYSQFKILKLLIPKQFLTAILSFVSSSDYAHASLSHQKILKNIVNYHLKSRLKKITVPTHIIWGDRDREISYTGKMLENLIPSSRLHVLYGVGHNPHLSHPKDLSALINRYLP
jgi:pimeloyl-ACP methyl ester carboxylesterase